MSRTTPAPLGDDVRSLPSRPNLEFEHKRAKALLRQLRAGDFHALARARVRHPALDASRLETIALADAQLIAAREYGFTSWPRLVRYFETLALDPVPRRELEDREGLDAWVRSLLIEHSKRRISAGRLLVTYAPRFYGMRVPDALDAEVTVDDARTVVARQRGYTNWETMLEEAAKPRRAQWTEDPMMLAGRAMDAFDFDELDRVIERHPELRMPSPVDTRQNHDVVVQAILRERRLPANDLRLTAWLAAHGFDVQRTLNRMLCGHMHISTDKVRYLLDRGADPDWVAPNGRSVLEHALVTYWNTEAVDTLAARARHPSALWIAAGLGDVDGVARFLDRDGKPTQAAYRSRPDFSVGFSVGTPPLPEPDDEEILVEAFMVAMLNRRTDVIEYMASRGFPVNSLAWGSPLISIAVGNAQPDLVECMLRWGASLDIVGYRPELTPRQMARDYFQPNNPDSHRVLQLCGGDPAAVIAELDARPAPEPQLTGRLQKVLEAAGDDAARRQQTEIAPVNILVGMFRVPHAMPVPMGAGGVDGERLRAALEGRLLPPDDRIPRGPLLLDAASQAFIARTIALVREQKMVDVMPHHLLYAMIEPEDGEVARFFASCGADVSTLRRMLSSF